MRLLAPRDEFDSVRPETHRRGRRRPRRNAKTVKRRHPRSFLEEESDSRQPAPDRGRAVDPRLRCTRAMNSGPGPGPRAERGEEELQHFLEFQGQRALAIDPHDPGPGPRAERGEEELRTWSSRGNGPLAIDHGPGPGPRAERGEVRISRTWSSRGNGPLSYCDLTAPVRGRGALQDEGASAAVLFQSRTSLWLLTAAVVTVGFNVRRILPCPQRGRRVNSQGLVAPGMPRREDFH